MRIAVRVIKGHGAASGRKNDPRYPKGTLAIQWSFFEKAGVSLTGLFKGTVNVDLAPFNYEIREPFYFAEGVNWSPYISPENFYFFEVKYFHKGNIYKGLIYLPDPETKEEHFQSMQMLELLLPSIEDLNYGDEAEIEINPVQLRLYIQE